MAGKKQMVCKASRDGKSYVVKWDEQTEAIIDVLCYPKGIYFAPRYAGMVGSDGCHATLALAIRSVERYHNANIVMDAHMTD